MDRDGRRPGRARLPCLLAAAALAGAAARALDAPLDALIVERWTTERGLPQNSVNAIVQSRDGWLWIATFGGLARFDGTRFEVYGVASDPGLPSSRIVALFEAADGALWLGTEEGGLVRFDRRRFTTVWTRAPAPAGGVVWSIAEGPDGDLWVGTDRGAVRRRADGTTRVYTRADGLPGAGVLVLRFDREGTLWAGTNAGAARLDGERFVALTRDPVWSLVAPPSGAPLLAAGERSVVELPSGRPWVVRRELEVEIEDGRGAVARAAWFDRTGALWLGGERLARRRADRVLIESDDAGRLGRHVRSLFEDREGNLWIGTEGDGLVQARVGRVATYGRERGLPSDSVLPVVEDGAGRLHVGGLCGGLARLEGERFVEVARPDGKSFTCVSALAPARDGGLWVAHRRIDKLGGAGTTLAPLAAAAAGSIRALHEDARGRLWIGGELGLFRAENGRVEPVPAVGHEPVWTLYAEPGGELWAGLVGAVARVDEKGGGARFSIAAPDAPGAAVRDFWRAPDGALWAATYGAGLARISPDGEIGRYGESAGLAELFVSRLLPDGRGGIWLSGNRGLYRLRIDELTELSSGRGRLQPVAFGVRDGLAAAEANGGGQPAGWRARDGRLFFPTVRGVAVVDPREERAPLPPPPVVVEQLALDGRPQPAADGFEVPAGTRRVELRFTALAFARPEQVRFRYRLVGFDRDWQEARGARSASYTGLAPRPYRFEVTAASPGGAWSATPAALAFSVAPRWTETLPVRLLMGAAAILVLVAVHRFRLARLRRRAAELRVLVDERTSELKSLNESLEQLVSDQTEQIRETRDMAILTLAKLAELRDGTTGEHLDRIAHFSRRLAEEVARGPFGPLGDDFIEELYRSSPLHDIGKVAIPDAILRKSGPLTEEEWEVMKSHTTIGGDTLRRVVARGGRHSFLSMAMEIAYQHHERWDGSGYPFGLRERAAGLPARIVAVADAYDALTSDRPYKPAYAHEEAVRRIAADRGHHFDPGLVDAFLSAHADFDRIRRAHPSAA